MLALALSTLFTISVMLYYGTTGLYALGACVALIHVTYRLKIGHWMRFH